jgi:acetate kinase
MPLKDSSILTVNGGSSSLKFKLFDHQSSGTLVASVRGKIERIGLPDSTFTVVREDGSKPEKTKVAVPDLASAVSVLETWLRKELGDKTIGTIVHRIVHGGPNYHVTQKITADLLAELKRIRFLDPDHLPGEISLIEGFQEKRPDATHIAKGFADTASTDFPTPT